jgi:hypothetical protein
VVKIASDTGRAAFLREVRERAPKPDDRAEEAQAEREAVDWASYRAERREREAVEESEGAGCERCGANAWAVRYGSYELLGTCTVCGWEESLYQG